MLPTNSNSVIQWDSCPLLTMDKVSPSPATNFGACKCCRLALRVASHLFPPSFEGALDSLPLWGSHRPGAVSGFFSWCLPYFPPCYAGILSFITFVSFWNLSSLLNNLFFNSNSLSVSGLKDTPLSYILVPVPLYQRSHFLPLSEGQMTSVMSISTPKSMLSSRLFQHHNYLWFFSVPLTLPLP